MKKTLLSFIFLWAIQSEAQTQVFIDDFNDEDVADWTLIDSDGDNKFWGDQFTVTNTAGVAVTPVGLISRSWQGTPLTPDNWAITPLIDLSAFSGNTVTLSWNVKAAAASWDQEEYSVYIGTTNDITDLINASVNYNEIYDDPSNSGPIINRTLDLSGLAGQGIYIAFRHHNCTDMDYLWIDDVTVTATILKSDSFFSTNFTLSPNPVKDVFTVNAKNNVAIQNITVVDINGRVVNEVNNSNSSEAMQVNIGELNAGVYFVKVQTELGVGTSKIIKK
jgi:hypothetical protein